MQMQAVEGLTPEILWFTLIGLVGIGTLIVLIDKVMDVFRKKHERDQKPQEDFAEVISKMVLKKLEPRLQAIDEKLANDNALLKAHTRTLEDHQEQIKAIESGNKVLCRGILALLSHEINGNSSDKLKESQQEITNYLIEK